MLILREPVARAFSGFHESNQRFKAAGVTIDPSGFALVAELEMDIVRNCDGLPHVEADGDERRQGEFARCCVAFVARTLHSSSSRNSTALTHIRAAAWPGCISPAGAPDRTPFGSVNAMPVRTPVLILSDYPETTIHHT